jgi:GNAT superfamily N-acetyltransferase
MTRPMRRPVSVVRATPEDVPRLAVVIAEAFLNLPPSRWLVPDPYRRRQMFPGFFTISYLDPAMDEGMVYCTTDRMGVAVWLPVTPPGPETTLLDTVRAADRARQAEQQSTTRQEALRRLTKDRYPIFCEFGEMLQAAHPTDRGPHDYLGVIAVAPMFWRRGYASALLTSYHRYLDREQRGAYLEAATPELVGLYRQFGYDETANPIRLPNGATMHPMWRQPRPDTEHAMAAYAEGLEG